MIWRVFLCLFVVCVMWCVYKFCVYLVSVVCVCGLCVVLLCVVYARVVCVVFDSVWSVRGVLCICVYVYVRMCACLWCLRAWCLGVWCLCGVCIYKKNCKGVLQSLTWTLRTHKESFNFDKARGKSKKARSWNIKKSQ